MSIISGFMESTWKLGKFGEKIRHVLMSFYDVIKIKYIYNV